MTCCNVLLLTYERKTALSSHRGIIKRIYWLPLKAIEFNGVDTTSFLKILVALMYDVDFF